MSHKRIVVLSIAVLLAAYSAYFFSRSAAQEGDWRTQYQRIPTVQVQGDTLTVAGMRDFRYAGDGAVAEARYIDKTFSLSALRGAWFGLSHFDCCGLAHAFVSFEFAEHQYLVVSIEARIRNDQAGYDPLAGMFRDYTKFVVLATEQDVIGLRSHIRKEPVFLYPLKGSMLQARALLLSFLRKSENLERQAEFYNTLTDNCLTGLLAESGRNPELYHWLDYRILLPGYADELLSEKGVFWQQGEIESIREQARVVPENTVLDDPLFSAKIRNVDVYGRPLTHDQNY